MDLSPHLARTIAFKTVRKGYDPAEVDAFKERAAAAIESAQNQAVSMEARARAAVSKLQELNARQTSPDDVTDESSSAPAAEGTVDEANVISRTLLVAQRTADQLIADAKETAAKLVAEAKSQASRTVESATAEARHSADQARVQAQNEVEALLAKRDFLSSDVDALDQHVTAQRERLRETAETLLGISERVAGGLGDMRRPLLSASDDRDPTPGDADAAARSDGTMAAEPTAVDQPGADEAETSDDLEGTLDFESSPSQSSSPNQSSSAE